MADWIPVSFFPGQVVFYVDGKPSGQTPTIEPGHSQTLNNLFIEQPSGQECYGYSYAGLEVYDVVLSPQQVKERYEWEIPGEDRCFNTDGEILI